MSDFNWCHGPECHTRHTVDRVRGVKGSKVLRTRKIKLHNYNRDNQWGYFCSNNCYNEFATKYIQQILAIAPRTECLETPILDPDKQTHTREFSWGTHKWTDTKIEVDETRQS